MTERYILLVEDQPLNRELVTDLLEADGHKIESAPTAEEGIALARAGRPDLILMDIALPGMDGLEALQILRDDPRTRCVPVVVVTAHAMRSDEEAARAAGCAGYVTKPFDTRAFRRLVLDVLSATGESDQRSA